MIVAIDRDEVAEGCHLGAVSDTCVVEVRGQASISICSALDGLKGGKSGGNCGGQAEQKHFNLIWLTRSSCR